MTIQNDLQNTTSQHGGRRRLDNAVADMMIKHITDQVQDQLANIKMSLTTSLTRPKRSRTTRRTKWRNSQGRVEELENVLTAGDDAQKYIDEKMSAGKDVFDSAMQATKEKVLLLIKPWSVQMMSPLVTRDLPR